MDPVSLVLGVCFIFTGSLVMLLCVPLMRRQIPRNMFYGVRLPTSLRSDAAWYAINRFGGRKMITWSIPIIALGVVTFFLPLQHHTALTLTLTGVELLFLFIPIFAILRYARRFKNRA